MAMVLLGVPRGQNFVAEAADEATKSVALLTLTLTGDPDEPLTAKMEWKSFVQGTTVGLEVIFIDEDGTAAGPFDFGSWLDTYGSMESDDAGFKTFAPADWLAALPFGTQVPVLFGADWGPASLQSVRLHLGTRDWFAPLPLTLGDDHDDQFADSPGVARLAVGSSLDLLSHPYPAFLHSMVPADSVLDLTLSADGLDASVASFDSASALLAGVAAGSTACALSFAGVITVPGQPQGVIPPTAFGTLAVEVYDPSVPVTGVTLSETATSLTVGETFDLTATISPENAKNKNVTWTSSDTSVATVDAAGKVTTLKAGKTTITVTADDGGHTATCEVTVTEAGGAPPPTTDEVTYLDESTVTVKGKQQRIRVYDPHQVLPLDAQLKVEAVTRLEALDDTHEIEHLLAYNISLLDANGDALPMPLSDKVELCFEVLDGLDKDELEVVLVQTFDDFEFAEELVELDGATWVKVQTDHFSPYALLDKLSPEEKGVQVQDNSGPKNNVKTGDIATQITAAGLGMMLVLALGVMLRLITNKRNFEE